MNSKATANVRITSGYAASVARAAEHTRQTLQREIDARQSAGVPALQNFASAIQSATAGMVDAR
jgi:hypothetical protein